MSLPGHPTEADAIALQEECFLKRIDEVDSNIGDKSKKKKHRIPKKSLNRFMIYKIWRLQTLEESPQEASAQWKLETDHIKGHYATLSNAAGVRHKQMTDEYESKEEASQPTNPSTSTTTLAASGSFSTTKSVKKSKKSSRKTRTVDTYHDATTGAGQIDLPSWKSPSEPNAQVPQLRLPVRQQSSLASSWATPAAPGAQVAPPNAGPPVMQHEYSPASFYQETLPFLGMPSSSTDLATIPVPAGPAPSIHSSVYRVPQTTQTTYQQAVYQETNPHGDYYPATSRVEHTGTSMSSSAHYPNNSTTMRRYEIPQTSNWNAPPLPHQPRLEHYRVSQEVYDQYLGHLDGRTAPLFASSDDLGSGQGYPGTYAEYPAYDRSPASTSNPGRPRKPSLYQPRRQPSSFSNLSRSDRSPQAAQPVQSQSSYHHSGTSQGPGQSYFDPMPEASSSSSTHWQPEASPSASASTTPSLILSPSSSGVSSSPPLEHQGGAGVDYEQPQEPQLGEGLPEDYGLESMFQSVFGPLPEKSTPSASIDFGSWLGEF